MTLRIKLWTNRLGAMASFGRQQFEIWQDGRVRRIVSDDSITGFTGTHYSRVPCGTYEEMASAARESWRTNRNDWQECE